MILYVERKKAGWLNQLKYFIGLLHCVLWIFLSTHAVARENLEPTIDIYKTNQISLEELKKKFGTKIKKISDLMSSPGSLNSASNVEELERSMKDIIAGINSMGDFSYVGISPILYPNDKVIHFTVDIVDKKDAHRLSYFLPKPVQNIIDPNHLIKKWLEYEAKGFSFVWKEKKFPEFKECPAHHCIFGFEHAGLKEYQHLFNAMTPKHKRRLISILRQDKDEKKRASAAFLLAHLKNSDEVVNILSPSIFDSSSVVRNNVIRVLATIFSNKTAKHPDFPIKKIVLALDFPEETDRNKALLLISNLIDNPSYADYVKSNASHILVAHLKLSQPNLHDPSFYILKKISKKNFSEHNYKAWDAWAESAQKE